MDPVTYLTTFSTDFGVLEWVFLIAQIATAIAGVYLAFLWRDKHPLRGALGRRLGYTLLGVGAIGTLLGVLRLANVQVFTMPIWFTVVTVLDVVLVAYVAYYTLAVYPARLVAYDEASRGRGSRRASRPQPALQTNGTNGSSSFATPRPAATTSRREARRDRKRKGR